MYYSALKREIEYRLMMMGLDVSNVTVSIPLQAFWTALRAIALAQYLFNDDLRPMSKYVYEGPDNATNCPWCNSSVCVDQSDTGYFVRCPECGSQGPRRPTPAGAISKWNEVA